MLFFTRLPYLIRFGRTGDGVATTIHRVLRQWPPDPITMHSTVMMGRATPLGMSVCAVAFTLT